MAASVMVGSVAMLLAQRTERVLPEEQVARPAEARVEPAPAAPTSAAPAAAARSEEKPARQATRADKAVGAGPPNADHVGSGGAADTRAAPHPNVPAPWQSGHDLQQAARAPRAEDDRARGSADNAAPLADARESTAARRSAPARQTGPVGALEGAAGAPVAPAPALAKAASVPPTPAPAAEAPPAVAAAAPPAPLPAEAPAATELADPALWYARIQALRRIGRAVQADAEWRTLRQRFPRFEPPADPSNR
jgi:hypothetical protein